jgi:hypothetical protein
MPKTLNEGNMAASLRLSRGFHRLALFLAAIPLLAISGFYLILAIRSANLDQHLHQEQVELACAQDAFHRKFYGDLSKEEFDRRIAAKLAPIEEGSIKVTDPDLKKLGCANESRMVSVTEIFRANPPAEFSWIGEFSGLFVPGLGLAFGLSVALYGLVRAIGWVIGGFAA